MQIYCFCTRYTSRLAKVAFNHDLNFIKFLFNYKKIDLPAAEKALHKFINHLWYSSPEAYAIAFFDNQVLIEIKKMVQKLGEINVDSSNDSPKRYYIHEKKKDRRFAKKRFGLFYYNNKSKLFFERFGIDKAFLQTDIRTWPTNTSYL